MTTRLTSSSYKRFRSQENWNNTVARAYSCFVLTVCLLLSTAASVLGFDTFDHIGIAHSPLIEKVHDDYWDITYKFGGDCSGVENRITDAELENAITKAVQIWLQPLRELKMEKPIVNDFRFNKVSFDSRLSDLKVTSYCTLGISTASVGRGLIPEVYIRTSGTELDPYYMFPLIHEVGHAFGLADTNASTGEYRSTGGLQRNKSTQPASIMASIFVEHIEFQGIRTLTADDWDNLKYLSQDDVNGIVWLYKYYYENQPLGDCYFPDYRFNGQHRGCVSIYPLIFELKNGNENLAIRVIGEDLFLDIGARDSHDYSALDYAIIHKYQQALQEVLRHRYIKVNAAGKDGHTALHLAASEGYEFGMEKLLSQADIDVNPVDKNGRTPLHRAVEHGHLGVVELLLTHREIDVNIRNSDGQTALQVAEKQTHTAIVKRLLGHPGIHVHQSADVNEDGVVNILDLVLVASRFGSAGKNRTDINGDGIINVQDLVIVANALE